MLKLFDIPETPINTKNEWYTPFQYIEAAREVMGSIDLDPASCELANRTVKATRYYTQEENGLQQEWYGNVWLNPPFKGTRSRKIWITKLVREYNQGSLQQAILLMPLGAETTWFQPLWQFPICCAYKRVVFFNPFTPSHRPPWSTCFTYLGYNEAKFIDVFSEHGTVVKRVN